MKTITIDELIKMEPCWLDEEDGLERIEKLWGKKKKYNALEILAREDIKIEDRFWIVLHPELLSVSTMVEAVCRFAEYAFSQVGRENIPQKSRDAISAARAYSDGEITGKEISEAIIIAAETSEWAITVSGWAENAKDRAVASLGVKFTKIAMAISAAAMAAIAAVYKANYIIVVKAVAIASTSATDAYGDMLQILIDLIKGWEADE